MSSKRLFPGVAVLVCGCIIGGCLTPAQMAAFKQKQAEREAAAEVKALVGDKKVAVGKPVQAKAIAVGKSRKEAVKKATPAGAPGPRRVTGGMEEVEASPLDAPEGIAYPRETGKTIGRLALKIDSLFWDQPHYRLSSFIVCALLAITGKGMNQDRSLYTELCLTVGYPSSSLAFGDVVGAFSDGDLSSEFSMPYLAFHGNIVASEIRIKEAGLFEVETRVGLGIFSETYPDVWLFDSITWDADFGEASNFSMPMVLRVVLRRMAGDPEPLKYLEPYGGLALHFLMTIIDVDSDRIYESETYFDIWLNLVAGVRIRPIKNLYGELELTAGPNETTIQVAIGFIG